MMNTEPQISQRCRCQSKPTPTPFLPNDLIVEIISWLPVKPLMMMKCVSKSFNNIISDPNFVKLHLNRSSQNTRSYVVAYEEEDDDWKPDDHYNFIPFSVADLSDMPEEPCYYLNNKDCRKVVGSCNGLVCLLGSSEHQTWFRLWNPATRTISDKFEFLHDDMDDWKFTFGCDNSTDTYKAVAIFIGNDSLTAEVRVFSFGDNIWRNIQSFPVMPIQVLWSVTSSELLLSETNSELFSGVHLNDTVNWLALAGIGQIVIISLDLCTETYKILCVPQEQLSVFPRVCVMMNYLCFYHDVKETDVIVWRMTIFGDEKSWTKWYHFSLDFVCHNFCRNNIFEGHCLHFNIYVNGDILVFIHDGGVILYNRINGKLLDSTYCDQICWLSMNDYVESLVSPC